jgi:hypothetical protein
MKPFALCLLFLLSTVVNAAQPEAIPRPEIKVGDQWVYSKTNNLTKQVEWTYQSRVSGVSAEGYRIESKRLDKDAPLDSPLYDLDWNRVGGTYSPPRREYSFPLAVGKTWETKYSWMTNDQRGEITYSGAVKIVGWESVTVAAGSFQALRLESEVWWRIGGDGRTGRDVTIYWYVPEVKRFVKSHFRALPSTGGPAYTDEVLELKEFTIH